ncbi:glyoxal reductase [Cohnella xylanilytica]|uniref:Aldo/keto reductase n=1 Tax=Cohnella xylanilytica TaxID=557555 RepID=A0A841TSK3_9BACL|nr:aldo/keto reductase [Cohnella xylanilytica]MBB6691276.1 aldo/keto reductase [Cohnella xylanilytica]GIO12849.1 glyoxal reductase [Cohnella xylanilytica]
MRLAIDSTAELLNGVRMPRLGLGVWRSKEGAETENAVAAALAAGYRAIDTASLYENEESVGRAVRASGIPREQVFITTKVWNNEQGYDSTIEAFRRSLKRLGTDYADLYLVHWPVKGKYKDTYRALETLYEEGMVKAIGVSNFLIHHLEDLMGSCRIKPMVNQVEMHPLLTRKPLLEFCRREGIQLESWRPLMNGRLDVPLIQELAVQYGKTPAQILIRWQLQLGVVTIPKSVHAERIRENADVFDFKLTREDMDRIDGLNEERRFGADPDNVDF